MLVDKRKNVFDESGLKINCERKGNFMCIY